MHWFQCRPDEVTIKYAQKMRDWHEAFPNREIISQQHSTCSTGSPMSPQVLVTILITSETRAKYLPSAYSTGPK